MKEMVYKRVLETLEATLNEHKPELKGMRIQYQLDIDDNGFPIKGGRLFIGIPKNKNIVQPSMRMPRPANARKFDPGFLQRFNPKIKQ